MMKLSIVIAAFVGVIVVTFAASLAARAQSAAQYDYNRVTPYIFAINEGRVLEPRVGYRACQALPDGWSCRDFAPKESSDDALRAVLAAFGNEGWELVSAVDADASSPDGLTYFFKRQRQ